MVETTAGRKRDRGRGLVRRYVLESLPKVEPFGGKDRKERARERIAARIKEESKDLPYRWGYFQGAILVPWTLFLILGSVGQLVRWHEEPWYLSGVTLVMGIIGLPLAYGLLWKKALAFPLLYATVGLALALVAMKLPIAITHFKDTGEIRSAFGEAEILLVWIASLPYYHKRKWQFH